MKFMSILKKSVINSSFNSLCLIVVSLLEILIVSNLYSLVEYGSYVRILLIINIMSALVNSVYSQIYLRRKITLNNIFIIISFVIVLIPFFILYIILNLTVLPNTIDFLIFFLIMYFSLMSVCIDSKLIRINRIKTLNHAYLLSSILSLLIVSLPYFNNSIYQINILFISLLVKHFVFVLFCVMKTGYKKNKITQKKIYYYYYITIGHINFLKAATLGMITNNIDRYIISILFGVEKLAIFSRSQQIVNVPIVFFNRLISKDLQSMMVKDKSTNDIFLLFLCSSLLCVFICHLTVEYLVMKLMGNEWQQLTNVIKVLIFILPIKICMKKIDVYIRVKSNGEQYKILYTRYFYSACLLTIICLFNEYFEIVNLRLNHVTYIIVAYNLINLFFGTLLCSRLSKC